MTLTLTSFASRNAAWSESEFVGRHPYPFLILQPETGKRSGRSAGFHTMGAGELKSLNAAMAEASRRIGDSEVYSLDGAVMITIGRTSNNDVVLEDPGISKLHAFLTADPLSGKDKDLDYWDVSLGWNVLPGEVFVGEGKAWNSAFYLIGGVGNADFNDDDEMLLNLGFGFRVLPRDNFSVRLDFRDYIFDSNATGDKKTTHNLQATLNLGWYF